MIIQSLARYYDILAGDDSVPIPKLGYSPAKVSFALIISSKGELTNILDLRTDGKKPIPKMMEVPYQKSRVVAVTPYFLCDNEKYVFGIEKVDNNEKKKSKGKKDYIAVLDTEKDESIVVSKRSLECYRQFRILHHSLLDGSEDPEIKSFLKFLDGWKPELTLNHLKIAEYKEQILAGGMFVFDVNGISLHKLPSVRLVWERHSSSDGLGQKNTVAQCLVSGKTERISRLHQKIIGVHGPSAQPSGTSLVSFNEDSFESYGKSQGFNAPVGEVSMFKYTTALNFLLDRKSRNRLQIGDSTTVFWAETRENTCEDLAHFLINPTEDQEETEEESSGDSKVQDHKTLQLVSDILQKVKDGKYLQENDLGIDPEKTKFYILGLSPNNARLAVRYWHEDSFGNFITRVARHHLDMEIVRDDLGPRYISVNRLLKETIPKSSTDKVSSPLLGGLLMRSILDNMPYPVQMYNMILNRVKVERSINYVRAGFIKAYLVRLARFRTKNEQDMITVSLNEESQSVPYRLGRLFAVLEKTQSDTNKDMKSTINSKYFSSASTTPAVVFPVLLKLAQHHIAKSDWGFKSNQQIEDVLVGVDEFPAYLNLEQQGMFMIGYYHQRKEFFKKKESNLEKKGE